MDGKTRKKDTVTETVLWSDPYGPMTVVIREDDGIRIRCTPDILSSDRYPDLATAIAVITLITDNGDNGFFRWILTDHGYLCGDYLVRQVTVDSWESTHLGTPIGHHKTDDDGRLFCEDFDNR